MYNSINNNVLGLEELFIMNYLNNNQTIDNESYSKYRCSTQWWTYTTSLQYKWILTASWPCWIRYIDQKNLIIPLTLVKKLTISFLWSNPSIPNIIFPHQIVHIVSAFVGHPIIIQLSWIFTAKTDPLTTLFSLSILWYSLSV